jgi:competence protein ComEA
MISNVLIRKRMTDVFLRVGQSCSVVLSLFLISSIFSAARAQSAPPPSLLPDGQGKQVIVAKCTQCHGPEMFALSRKTADDWDAVITKMTSNGLVITDEEYAVIMDYLTKNLGPLPAKINVNKASAAELQKGLDLTDAEAQAIVKFHTDHGDFKTWNDVAKVDGVDPKKIEAKKDSIAF